MVVISTPVSRTESTRIPKDTNGLRGRKLSPRLSFLLIPPSPTHPTPGLGRPRLVSYTLSSASAHPASDNFLYRHLTLLTGWASWVGNNERTESREPGAGAVNEKSGSWGRDWRECACDFLILQIISFFTNLLLVLLNVKGM